MPISTLPTVSRRIADELAVGEHQVSAAVALLDGGATVPFVARYRKEATGGLDDAQLRTLDERLRYLRELDTRRAAVLASIEEQGKLDDTLRASIMAAETKSRLEDIYLPFKPRRRTRAQIAREAGLEPLANLLLAEPGRDPESEAGAFVDADRGVADRQAALDGARSILVERFAEDADLVGELRERAWKTGDLAARVVAGQETAGEKFSDYFDHRERLTRAPSHRILAMFRGEKEGVLTLEVDPDPQPEGARPAGEQSVYERTIASRFGISAAGRPGDAWLAQTVRLAWRGRVGIRVDVDLRLRLRERAEADAIGVFAANLRDLLLAAPAGPRPTLGLDPGFRTGVKVAVVDATGKAVDTAVIHPHQGSGRWDQSLATLSALVTAHGVELVAIGNGTASRETDRLAGELVGKHPGLTKVVVSEAGASVYSASAYASAELPGMDVSLRGAVSIARRLQDPLAELVKIDARSIGVGQYQHDLPQGDLSRSLDAVVEDAVNGVGVDVNTASVPLLARVSGLGTSLAESIVAHRDAHGAFPSRRALKDVPRLGPKAFEQSAGFLRVRGGDEPLDASAVHPESYPVARAMAKKAGCGLGDLIGSTEVLRGLQPVDFVDEKHGLPTVLDVLAELEKPGRDPRPTFAAARFAEGVEKVADLVPGMVLEGVVTNCAAFGAFVDVGVHQDGLVHVSALSDRFVSDPREVVKPGDVVRVKVLTVDVRRGRIGLTLRLDDPVPGAGGAEADPAARTGAGGGTGGSAGGGAGAPRSRGSRNAAATRRPEQGGAVSDRSAKGRDGKGATPQDRPAQGGDRRRDGRQAAPESAMAEALRRAGFGKS